MSAEPKKILITGAEGQVGRALLSTSPGGIKAIPAGRSVLDITDKDAVQQWVADHKPAGIINAAAYTAVDQAEQESALAYAVNADGPGNLALAAQEASIPFVHISTDFVFDGCQATPYKTTDAVNPLSVYGKSKAQGEKFITAIHPEQSAIIRTSWVYSAGHANFVSTMIRLMNEKDQLTVVSDQIGTPTSALSLAGACWAALRRESAGIFHWSDAGVASWYDFAVAIQEEGLQAGIVDKTIPIHPVTSADFATAAARPAFSVLDKMQSWEMLGLYSAHWRTTLRESLLGWNSPC